MPKQMVIEIDSLGYNNISLSVGAFAVSHEQKRLYFMGEYSRELHEIVRRSN